MIAGGKNDFPYSVLDIPTIFAQAKRNLEKFPMKTQKITLNHAERISLEIALNGDFRQLSCAYPVLARYGYMERTTNGFKAIDPESVRNRIKQLLLSA